MRRLIVWNLMSLDGYFEGPEPWDLSFHDHAWGPELEALSREYAAVTGALIFGRRTYDGMAAHWTKASGPTADFMNGVEKWVASHGDLAAPWSNARRLEGDALAAIGALKAQPGKDLFVYGSANLVGQLLAAGHVDELHLCVAPVLLGRGAPLFAQGAGTRGLDLAEARPLSNGAVILRYRPQA